MLADSKGRFRAKILVLTLAYAMSAMILSFTAASAPAAEQREPVVEVTAEATPPPTDLGKTLRQILWVFLVLSLISLGLLVATVVFLLWRAKQLVENAVKPNPPKLQRLVAKLRRKHPELGDRALAKKIIHRQANRSGLVGFITGLGGLPTLPIAIPIDLAATIKIQSNLVHLLRLVHGGRPDEHVSDASLWLITTGGQELTSASSALIRNLLVKFMSKSLLKFLPLLGGVVGYALNWTSTQALGRLTLTWLDRQDEA